MLDKFYWSLPSAQDFETHSYLEDFCTQNNVTLESYVIGEYSTTRIGTPKGMAPEKVREEIDKIIKNIESKHYDPYQQIKKLKKELEKNGFKCDVKINVKLPTLNGSSIK